MNGAQRATLTRRMEECSASQNPLLDLDELELTELPRELASLTHVRILRLTRNRLASLPEWFPDLGNLRDLSLHGNPLGSFPPQLRRMEQLTDLGIGNSGISELPQWIGQLQALESLRCWLNEVSHLPDGLWDLEKLEWLDLEQNRLTQLPGSIGRLRSLLRLELSNNRLRRLPPEIAQLTSLKELNLASNDLESLPESLLAVASLQELYLHQNPKLGLPDSLLGPTNGFGDNKPTRPEDILRFYFSQRGAAAQGTLRAVDEVKVMLVGRGGAGKTSLRRFFLGQAHDRHELETPGVALDTFPLPVAGRPVTVHLWDFAGQEITHALHQFFLTEGCVYVLVLDPRSNTEMADAEYWLALLSRYARTAPALVALNRQDARQGGYDVDRRALKARFPFIHSFTPTNCDQRTGVDQLASRLADAVASLDNTEPPNLQVPEPWRQIMADCAAPAAQGSAPKSMGRLARLLGLAGHAGTEGVPLARQHMSLEDFRQICVRRGEADPQRQESLARLLHKLGTVLHFVDEPRLRDTAVLSPHWVTDAVYRLLRARDRPDSDGVLTLEQARAVLPGEGEAGIAYLLRLMERFEMCFPLDEGDGGAPATRWLVPGALTEFQPEGIDEGWRSPDAVRLRYTYEALPEGVLPRFIVHTHPWSDGQPRWRRGVVLRDGTAAALVRRGDKPQHVEVTGLGPAEERLRLLEFVQGTFERINANLPPPGPLLEIELAEMPGVYRSVADLAAAEAAGFEEVPVATGTKVARVAPTPTLNQASEVSSRSSDRTPLAAFLSYSHLDRRAKSIFQQNLTVMAMKRLTEHWQDGMIEPGTRWREQIDRNLDRMDLFVGLLTTNFLASRFIQDVELAAARRRLDARDKGFRFVLILVHPISLDGLDLAEYQLICPGNKAVSQHLSLARGFDAAQKELEAVVAALQPRRRIEALEHELQQQLDSTKSRH